MQVKDRAVVKIEKVAFGGDGVGRIDNFVVFVPFAAPGDELEIEIVQGKRTFARGKTVKIINASPFRVEPMCLYYEKCGGCCLQHIRYDEQLKIKEEQVYEAFAKIGKIMTPPVLPVIASPQAYHYRGKAQFHRILAAAAPEVGFLDVSGGKVVDIERCIIMEETINEKIGLLRENQSIPAARTRLTVWSDRPAKHADEKMPVMRLVKGKEFLVPRDGFFQNNLFLTEKLVDEVSRLALSGPLQTMVDVYCGCGLFSVCLASFAGKVLGIELNSRAVKFARINAAAENLKNVAFFCGEAAEELSKGEFLSLAGNVDLLIIDPPRLGCSRPVLVAIGGLRPQRIIYVSCDPSTQARDIRFLCASGYKISVLQPLDMFPQTQHIEVVALLERG